MTKDLLNLFKKADNTLMLASERLQELYIQKGLTWSNEGLRGLKGDIFTKVLGSYLEKKLGVRVEYEVKLTGRIRADILLNDKVGIESKAHGIYSLDVLKKRYERVAHKRKDIYQIVVGWRHNLNYVNRHVRIVIRPEHHFMFYDIEKKRYLPEELERLIKIIKRVSRSQPCKRDCV